MFGSKMYFSANYETDIKCQCNFGSKMIISQKKYRYCLYLNFSIIIKIKWKWTGKI